MSAKDLLSAFIEKNAEANINLNNIAPNIRAGVEGNVRAAKEAANVLRLQYCEEVTKNAFIIAVKGKLSEEFAKMADDNFETLSLNHDGLLDKFYSALKVKLARDTYSQYEHATLLHEIVNLKNELGIVQMPLPVLNTKDSYYNQELRKSIGMVLEKTYGESLNAVFLKKQMFEKALERRFDGTALPVVLYNYRGNLNQDFLPRPVHVIDLDEAIGDNIDKLKIDLVKSLLTDVKSKIRKPRKSKAGLEVTVLDVPYTTVSASELETLNGGKTNE